MDENIIGRSHYKVAKAVCFPMISLSEDDRLTVYQARKVQKFLSQPFQVAEVFTGKEGKFVPLADTIKGFREIVTGKWDHLPEMAFVHGR